MTWWFLIKFLQTKFHEQMCSTCKLPIPVIRVCSWNVTTSVKCELRLLNGSCQRQTYTLCSTFVRLLSLPPSCLLPLDFGMCDSLLLFLYFLIHAHHDWKIRYHTVLKTLHTTHKKERMTISISEEILRVLDASTGVQGRNIFLSANCATYTQYTTLRLILHEHSKQGGWDAPQNVWHRQLKLSMWYIKTCLRI